MVMLKKIKLFKQIISMMQKKIKETPDNKSRQTTTIKKKEKKIINIYNIHLTIITIFSLFSLNNEIYYFHLVLSKNIV